MLGGSTLAPKSAAAATKVPTSFDAGIANDEKLIEMLKREGKLAKNASPAESEKALKSYLKGKNQSTKTKDNLPKSLANIKKSDKGTSNGLKNGKGNKLGQAKKNTVDPVQKEGYTGDVRTDKVLVLAIDFSDYEKSSITKEETDMFYEDYTHDHFQDMIFGKNGYTGPDGKNYISMKQYYEQQSGGSYTVEGTVAGWYKADHEAAYYGANYPGPEDSDIRARSLVFEALTKAAKDPSINLADYDVWDRDDYDGDGVYNEPDAIIDHLMVIHAGVGEEAGGGSLGGDAIWSHRSKLSTGPIAVPGGKSNSNRFGGLLGAWDYTIEPEDGAAGVFTHEFGHDLGLPDEYDTQYTGAGEPVEYWSLMSSGSWGGAIPGTEPPGISPYSREMLQALHGGNWLTGTTLNASDITKAGTNVLLDEGVTKGTNDDAVRIDLPDKENSVNTPTSGQFEYYSGSGNEMENSMVTSIDLSSATSAELKFNAWYDIEEDWDYASIQVKEEGSTTWAAIQGNITTAKNPNDQNPGNGITGTSDGWVPATFDLSAYAGKKIDLKFNYWTDPFVAQRGLYIDDISITAGTNTVLDDDAEGVSKFTLDGFTKDKGKFLSKHYYLLEWRTHNGVDQGLAHIRRGASLMSYDPGLVVWYVDETYDNNWTGVHPGDGFLGVVDADQHTTYWSDKAVAATRYQVHDAAFGLSKTDKMFLDYSNIPGFGVTMKDNFSQRNPLFDDSANYSNAGLVDAGRKVPNYGLKFRVVGESPDGTVGKVLIFK
ncbi:M6 family metalloprotease domain-containing protein [Priestia megaterium]|uniref:M6 family metalloprotease domain-containing protein n=1 Tax=Priestia megaterium TaxID=1404 RepID=A0A6H1PBJ0_PRIMG|nr:immune inhibitor A domain-containing protein [Priestia megaterium]QIZ10747.1 M6 family metalloprotease domain-containing protein [Priestia megaterium]